MDNEDPNDKQSVKKQTPSGSGGFNSEDCDCDGELSDYAKIPTVVCHPQALLRNGICAIVDPVAKIVAESSRGIELLSYTETLKPRLAIVDAEVERENTSELCKRIRDMTPAPNVLIVSNNAYALSKIFNNFIRAGVEGFCLYKSGPRVFYDAIRITTRGLPYCDPKLFDLVKRVQQGFRMLPINEPEGKSDEYLEAERLAIWAIEHRKEHKKCSSTTIVSMAQEEARRLGHNFVGTENLLLGMLGIEKGIAFDVLTGLGITLASARTAVESIVGRGCGFVAIEIPFTPRAKRVLEFAWDEARHLGHNFIDSEHFLLGIVRDGEGAACRALEDLGIELNVLRDLTLQRISERKL